MLVTTAASIGWLKSVISPPPYNRRISMRNSQRLFCSATDHYSREGKGRPRTGYEGPEGEV
jgi:hypothetical protein